MAPSYPVEKQTADHALSRERKHLEMPDVSGFQRFVSDEASLWQLVVTRPFLVRSVVSRMGAVVVSRLS